jgi:hypothetical protein
MDEVLQLEKEERKTRAQGKGIFDRVILFCRSRPNRVRDQQDR